MTTPAITTCAIRFQRLLKIRYFAISGRGSVDYTPGSIKGRLDIGFSTGNADNIQRVESVSRVSGRRIGNC